MTEDQKKQMQVGKKENVIKANSNKPIFDLLELSSKEYEDLSVFEKYDKLKALVNEKGWKGQRKTLAQKEKEINVINLDSNIGILKDILLKGSKEEKDALNSIIKKHKKVIKILQLEKDIEKQEKELEKSKAELEGLKRE